MRDREVGGDEMEQNDAKKIKCEKENEKNGGKD